MKRTYRGYFELKQFPLRYTPHVNRRELGCWLKKMDRPSCTEAYHNPSHGTCVWITCSRHTHHQSLCFHHQSLCFQHEACSVVMGGPFDPTRLNHDVRRPAYVHFLDFLAKDLRSPLLVHTRPLLGYAMPWSYGSIALSLRAWNTLRAAQNQGGYVSEGKPPRTCTSHTVYKEIKLFIVTPFVQRTLPAKLCPNKFGYTPVRKA